MKKKIFDDLEPLKSVKMVNSIMLRFCIYLFGALLTILAPTASVEGKEPKVYLLRAPRSGSHWFFYCTNTLFKKSIHTESKEDPYRENSYYNNEGGRIITAHNPYDLHLDSNSHNDDLLILLIRNYRESLLRNYENPEVVKNEIIYQGSFNYLSQQIDWVLNLRMNHYFHNLRVYDVWNPKKRLMVYYEDLLQNPGKILVEVAEFIGETGKEKEIQTFVDNIDEHMEKSLDIYEEKKIYTSHTRGKSFLHHTNKIGLEKSLKIDDLAIKYFPDFIEKYLSRYLLNPVE